MLDFLIVYLEIGAVIAFVALIAHLIWDEKKPSILGAIFASAAVTVLWPASLIGFAIDGVRKFAQYMARS